MRPAAAIDIIATDHWPSIVIEVKSICAALIGRIPGVQRSAGERKMAELGMDDPASPYVVCVQQVQNPFSCKVPSSQKGIHQRVLALVVDMEVGFQEG